MSIRRSIVAGSMWVGALSYLGQGMGFIASLVLAGLLQPADYGTYGAAAVFVGWLGLVRDLGLGAALMQDRGDETEAASTSFWLMLALGVVLALGAFAAAPFVGSFFNSDAVIPIVRALSLNFLIFPFISVPSTLLKKSLRFREMTVVGLTAGFLSAVLSIALAWAGAGAWSFVGGTLGGSAFTGTCFLIMGCFRPRRQFRLSTARRLGGFSNVALLNTVLIFANRTIDNAAVGRLLGTQMLGYYNFAFRMGSLPHDLVTFRFYDLIYPVYARLRDDLPRARAAHLAVLRALAIVTVPISLLTVTVGPDAFGLLYANKWQPAIPALMILVFHGLVSANAGPYGAVFYAHGKPQYLTLLDLGKMLATLPLIPWAAGTWNIVGVAGLFTITNCAFAVAGMLWSCRMLRATWREYLGCVWQPVVAAILSWLASRLLGAAIAPDFLSNWPSVLILAGVSLAVYAAVLLVLDTRLRILSVRFVVQPRSTLRTFLLERTA